MIPFCKMQLEMHRVEGQLKLDFEEILDPDGLRCVRSRFCTSSQSHLTHTPSWSAQYGCAMTARLQKGLEQKHPHRKENEHIITGWLHRKENVIQHVPGQKLFPYYLHVEPLPLHERCPYHIVPYHTVPYRAIPFHSIPYHTIPYHTIPYHTVPYRTIPYHTIPY